VALGGVWVALSLAGLAVPRRLGLVTGVGFAILGGQLGLETAAHGLAYGLTIAAGLAAFALYWWERATVLLVAGVVAVTLAVPEAVVDLTGNSLGGPTVLLVAGAVLVAASALGLRLRGIRSARPAPDAARGEAETPHG